MSEQNLEDLRKKIDHIDTEIHDLIIKRTETVTNILKIKKQQNTDNKHSFYRPSREAEMLRRLLKRHQGDLPHSVIVAIWRTLMTGFCAMQGEFSVAYCSPQETEALRDLVRYYFGSTIRIKKSGTELSVLHAVSSDEVTVGVVPLYSEDDVDEWWINLPTGIYVSGVLPFVKNDHVYQMQQDYILLSASLPEPTGHDKTLLKVTAGSDVGKTSVINCFTKLNYVTKSHTIVNPKGQAERYHLIEVEDYIASEDFDELKKQVRKITNNKIFDVVHLGSFPAPIDLLETFQHEVF